MFKKGEGSKSKPATTQKSHKKRTRGKQMRTGRESWGGEKRCAGDGVTVREPDHKRKEEKMS